MQFVGQSAALCLQLVNALRDGIDSRFFFCKTFLPQQLQAAQFGVLILGFLRRTCGTLLTDELLVRVYLCLRLILASLTFSDAISKVCGILQEDYLSVDGVYLSLMLLEVAIGLQVVEHRRHVALPVAPPEYLTGVSTQAVQLTSSICGKQYAEHLATLHLLVPIRAQGDIRHGVADGMGKKLVVIGWSHWELIMGL